MNSYLQTDRLQLRAPELTDLDFLFHIENDTRQWCVSACKTPYSRYLLQQYIETNTHDIYADKQVRLMIEDHTRGVLVGAVDLFDFSPADRRAEIGLVIDHAARGRGYARAVLPLLCQYAQHVLGLHQIYAYIFEDNAPARTIFRDYGFTHVATLPDWVFSEGKYINVCLYQLIFAEK